MERGAIDVCNFDASWSGGYTSWRRMAAAAHLYSVELAHHEEPQVAAHLLASQPHGTYLEVFHPDRDPIWWRMIANRPELVDGEAGAADRPRPRLGARPRVHRALPDRNLEFGDGAARRHRLIGSKA